MASVARVQELSHRQRLQRAEAERWRLPATSEGANDAITDTAIGALVAEPRAKSRGAGGLAIWDRASRFLDLRTKFHWNGENAAGFANNLFDPKHWLGAAGEEGKSHGRVPGLRRLR